MNAVRWLLAAALVCPQLAHADLRDAVNRARLQGCSSTVARAPLRANARLDAAALRMAAGSSLHAALSAAGYLASQSSAVHLSGDVAEAQVSRSLVANDCRSLTDPALLEMGLVHRGRDLWLVLAAPVSLPSNADAPAVRLEVLGLVNQARARGRRCGTRSFPAAAPLTLSRALSVAALAHSEDMAKHHEFEHRGHDGSSPSTRVARAGYGEVAVVGENIAAGAMTPAEVTQGWLASPAHCENIMDPRFTELGLGYAVNLASEELVYWTQDFALPVGSARRPR